MSMETPSMPELELPRDRVLDPVVIARKQEVIGAVLLVDESKSLVAMSVGDVAVGRSDFELAA